MMNIRLHVLGNGPAAATVLLGVWLALLCAVTAPLAWVSLTMPAATDWVKATGMPLEWEWLDAAQTARFFEGDPEWRTRGGGHLTDQNAARTVAPVFISLLGKWLHDAWLAGLVVVWLSWSVCTWAIVQLVARYRRIFSEESGMRSSVGVAMILMGTSTGYLSFVGSIDVHVVGYTASVLGIVMVLNFIALPDVLSQDDRWPILFGLGVFLVEGSLQLGAPLLAFWALLLGKKLIRADRTRRWKDLCSVARILIVCGGCAVGWSMIARAGSDGSFDVHNEAVARALEAVSDPVALVSALPLKALVVFGHILELFRWWLVVAAFLGWVFASWEVRYWTGCWFVLVIGATLLTQYKPSTVFLVFPVVYVLAAIAAGRLAEVLVRLNSGFMFGSYRTAVAAGVPVLVVSLVPALTQLGFLWGDYTMPAVWWPGP